jgi:hypothetical protein
MAVPLHPFLTGQAHRIRYLHDALSYIAEHEGSWLATGSAIMDQYQSTVRQQMTGDRPAALIRPIRALS